MKVNIQPLIYLLSLVILLSSCDKKIDLLASAKNKISESNYISFTETAFYPIPDSDLTNKLVNQTEVLFNQKDSLGYYFIQKKDNVDKVYQGNQIRVVDHKNRTTRHYQPKHFKSQKQFLMSVKNSFRNNYSPMSLLKEDWEYVKDTIIDNSTLKNYIRIERERVVNNNKIRTEQHIFINQNALIEKFERRNYNNGKLSQRVKIDFSDYKLEKNKITLDYTTPNNYISMFGLGKPLKDLKVGDKAPIFSGITTKGKTVSSKDLIGKKTLLNFSVIACGNCKQTLDYINKDDFTLNDKISYLYINPEDDKTRMDTYIKRTNVPFPIIASAKKIAKNYGVNSYPRFFLVNEKGIIEKIVRGFDKEFLDSFKQ